METVNKFTVAKSHSQIPDSINGFTRAVIAGLDKNQAQAKAQALHSPASWYYKGKLYVFIAERKAEK